MPDVQTIRFADYGAISSSWSVHQVARFAVGVAGHLTQTEPGFADAARTELAKQLAEWLRVVQGGCGDPIAGPDGAGVYTCTLSAFHEGDHEDEPGHASWPRQPTDR